MSIIPSSSPTTVAFLNLKSDESRDSFAVDKTPVPQASSSATPIDNSDLQPVKSAVSKPTAAISANRTRMKPTTSGSATQGEKRKLHRLGEVRISQGISERTMCRRLNIDIKQLRALEDPTSNVPLSMLLAVRDVLDVPFADLLVESDGLSRPIHERAKLLKVMKTAVSIKECKLSLRATRLAQMLNEQLIELMPELENVGGWPEYGTRRGSDSIARILSDEIDTSQLYRE